MIDLIIHHYGFATSDLEQSIIAFRSIGFHVDDIVIDPVQNVRIAFASHPINATIELISDIDEFGPTSHFISKNGNGLYHICYEVNNLDETIKLLRENSFLLRHPPVHAVALNNRRIAWMYNRYIGLFELLEKS